MYKELIVDYWSTIGNHEWEYLKSFYIENSVLKIQDQLNTIEEMIKNLNDNYYNFTFEIDTIEEMNEKVVSIVKCSNSIEQIVIISFFTIKYGKIMQLKEYYTKL